LGLLQQHRIARPTEIDRDGIAWRGASKLALVSGSRIEGGGSHGGGVELPASQSARSGRELITSRSAFAAIALGFPYLP
jgi:hypothetical protein